MSETSKRQPSQGSAEELRAQKSWPEQQGQHEMSLTPSRDSEGSSVGLEAKDGEQKTRDKAEGRTLGFEEAGSWAR